MTAKIKTIVLNMVDRHTYSENELGVPVEAYTPCVIAIDSIRCFYKRHENRPGTRITFKDGGGFAVGDSIEAIAGLLGVSAEAPELPPVPVAPAPESDAAAEAEALQIEATQH